MRFAFAWIALLAFACSIEPATQSAACIKDGDCKSGETCLADFDRGQSYCTTTCASNLDCPAFRACRKTVDHAGSGANEVSLCIERVRQCQASEVCDGLDDDCDGTIDGPSCAPIRNCVDDSTCGLFACTARPAENETICAEKVQNPPRRYFETCTAPADCENNACDTGLCSPFCHPRVAGSCPSNLRCMRAVGESPARHNACQKECATSADCTAPQVCVWRDVHNLEDAHAWVCATPAPGRKNLGETCSSNNPDGDDECASGLCFENRCTRSCPGPGNDCSDVGANLVCKNQTLFYGLLQFPTFLCSENG